MVAVEERLVSFILPSVNASLNASPTSLQKALGLCSIEAPNGNMLLLCWAGGTRGCIFIPRTSLSTSPVAIVGVALR
jgi:hypothetical protein